jgi:hypothetical protein
MQITPHVHSLRIPFKVPTGPGQGIDRFVNVFVLLGTRTWVVDTGVAGSHTAVLDLVRDDPLVSIESVRKLKSLKDVRALVSARDDARLGEDAQGALNRAIELIVRIHAAVRVVSKQIDPTDLLTFCRKVLSALQLPETFANPLVARTFLGHYKLRERETLCG